jgi:hypothetical protein
MKFNNNTLVQAVSYDLPQSNASVEDPLGKRRKTSQIFYPDTNIQARGVCNAAGIDKLIGVK